MTGAAPRPRIMILAGLLIRIGFRIGFRMRLRDGKARRNSVPGTPDGRPGIPAAEGFRGAGFGRDGLRIGRIRR